MDMMMEKTLRRPCWKSYTTLLMPITWPLLQGTIYSSTGTVTPVGEYISFEHVLEGLQAQDMEWFKALVSPLSPTEQKKLQDVMTNAQ